MACEGGNAGGGRKHARGIAQLLRMGWHCPVKSADAQDVQALLVGR